MATGPPERKRSSSLASVGSASSQIQYVLDLHALPHNPESSALDIQEVPLERVNSEEIGGPEDFTQNMELWMRPEQRLSDELAGQTAIHNRAEQSDDKAEESASTNLDSITDNGTPKAEFSTLHVTRHHLVMKDVTDDKPASREGIEASIPESSGSNTTQVTVLRRTSNDLSVPHPTLNAQTPLRKVFGGHLQPTVEECHSTPMRSEDTSVVPQAGMPSSTDSMHEQNVDDSVHGATALSTSAPMSTGKSIEGSDSQTAAVDAPTTTIEFLRADLANLADSSNQKIAELHSDTAKAVADVSAVWQSRIAHLEKQRLLEKQQLASAQANHEAYIMQAKHRAEMQAARIQELEANLQSTAEAEDGVDEQMDLLEEDVKTHRAREQEKFDKLWQQAETFRALASNHADTIRRQEQDVKACSNRILVSEAELQRAQAYIRDLEEEKKAAAESLGCQQAVSAAKLELAETEQRKLCATLNEKSTLLDNLEVDSHGLKRENALLKQDLEAANKERDQLRAELDMKSAALSMTEDRDHNSEREMRKLRRELETAVQDQEALRAELEKKTHMFDTALSRADCAISEGKRLMHSIQLLEDERDELRTKNAELNHVLKRGDPEAFEQERSQLRGKTYELQNTVAALQAKVKQQAETLDYARMRQSSEDQILVKEIRDRQDEIDKLKVQLAPLLDAEQLYSSEKLLFTQQLEDYQTTITDMYKNIATLIDEVSQHKTEAAVFGERNKSLEAQLATSQDEATRQRKKLDVNSADADALSELIAQERARYEAQIQGLTNERDGLRVQLSRLDQGASAPGYRSESPTVRHTACQHHIRETAALKCQVAGIKAELKNVKEDMRCAEARVLEARGQVSDVQRKMRAMQAEHARQNELMDEKVKEKMMDRNADWARRYATLKAERDTMARVLMQQWGKEEMGEAQPQTYQYQYVTER
ncbi:hypothetical protein EJ06DRAFT_528037 [Trichodelitschia bisporula]|uniref:Uncharacterized protein n=1 Tax=Trichodelitschia bisporula TaxID=703511 RepID=A0A6G1I446_9PEZI|nr:hypothetical protein EJ06DRAFT_528037 [Trichodelitschia bisporula]